MPAKKGLPEEMISPDEVARRIGINPDAVRSEIRSGVFPIGWAFSRDGRKWTYHIVRKEFEAMMAGQLPTNLSKLAKLVSDGVVAKISEASWDDAYIPERIRRVSNGQ